MAHAEHNRYSIDVRLAGIMQGANPCPCHQIAPNANINQERLKMLSKINKRKTFLISDQADDSLRKISKRHKKSMSKILRILITGCYDYCIPASKFLDYQFENTRAICVTFSDSDIERLDAVFEAYNHEYTNKRKASYLFSRAHIVDAILRNHNLFWPYENNL